MFVVDDSDGGGSREGVDCVGGSCIFDGGGANNTLETLWLVALLQSHYEHLTVGIKTFGYIVPYIEIHSQSMIVEKGIWVLPNSSTDMWPAQ